MSTYATRSLFVPSPTTHPLSILAAILPPFAYYCALFLLPPLPSNVPPTLRGLLTVLKFSLAAVSFYTFAVLPLHYHYPGSAILTYQLGLVGWYGAGRVLDVFFLSWPRVPRRIVLPPHAPGKREAGKGLGKGEKEVIRHPYPAGANETWNFEPHPSGLFTPERAWWALDLMISMRGIGWDFASADVRHDTHPWQPPSSAQLRRAFFKLLPILIGCLGTIRKLHPPVSSEELNPSINDLNAPAKVAFVATTGVALYALFDFGYTLASALALPVLADVVHGQALAEARKGREGRKRRQSGAKKRGRVDALRLQSQAGLGGSTGTETETETETDDDDVPHRAVAPNHSLSLRNVDFFPLLNPAGFTEATTVRRFWSFAWHRLFGRFFGIYGILPFTYVAYLVEDLWEGKLWDAERSRARREVWPAYHADPVRSLQRGRADWAKVLGAFTASGVIHAVSERAALGGRVAVPPTNVWVEKGRMVGMGHEVRSSAAEQGGVGGVLAWLTPTRLVPPVSGAGEFGFFALNGVAVVVEGAVARYVMRRRRRSNGGQGYTMWYDLPVAVAWTLTVLLYTGQLFVEGWIRSGISRELGLIMD
ncbi:hypothetical protein ACQY0O_004583 [Thecaphora frezii]